jgi:hypothetical protein
VSTLGAAPQAGGRHHRARRQPVHVVALLGDEGVRGVIAFRDRCQDYPLRQLCGYVFEGVDREVRLPLDEGLVELAGEDVPPVYDGERGLRVVIAGGLYDADLYR